MKKLALDTRAKRAADRRRVVLATAAAAGFAAMTVWAPSAWAACPAGQQGQYICSLLNFLKKGR